MRGYKKRAKGQWKEGVTKRPQYDDFTTHRIFNFQLQSRQEQSYHYPHFMYRTRLYKNGQMCIVAAYICRVDPSTDKRFWDFFVNILGVCVCSSSKELLVSYYPLVHWHFLQITLMHSHHAIIKRINNGIILFQNV